MEIFFITCFLALIISQLLLLGYILRLKIRFRSLEVTVFHYRSRLGRIIMRRREILEGQKIFESGIDTTTTVIESGHNFVAGLTRAIQQAVTRESTGEARDTAANPAREEVYRRVRGINNEIGQIARALLGILPTGGAGKNRITHSRKNPSRKDSPVSTRRKPSGKKPPKD